MSNPIGGFFGEEVNLTGNQPPHEKAFFLNTGRACLNLMLRTIKPSKVYLPYYTCDALLEPFVLNKVSFSFYNLNEDLEPLTLPDLGHNEFIVYINYFGLKESIVKKLINIYSEKLIIDNSQAFFSIHESKNFSFNTARKYFGVPDGAYLYSPIEFSETFEPNSRIKTDHLVLRKRGIQEQAFKAFSEYESTLDCEIYAGSEFSKSVLRRINYEDVKKTRISNFKLYHQVLNEFNIFPIDAGQLESVVPFCYPLSLNSIPKLELLYSENIFVPVFWKDVINRRLKGFKFEEKFTLNTLSLPVDHRYSSQDILFVTDKIFELILK